MTAKSSTLLILAPTHEDGGAERNVRTISAAAIDRGWTVHVGLPQIAANSTLRTDLTEGGASCHDVAIGSTTTVGWSAAALEARREARRVGKLARELRPDAVLTVLPYVDACPGALLASSLLRVPAVSVVQLARPGLKITPSRRRLYALTRSLGQRWIAVSQDNAARLAAAMGWPTEAVGVIYNGVPVAPELPAIEIAEARARIRRSLALPADAKLILTPARLSEQKAHDVIADSVRLVSRAHPDAYWLWAGGGAGDADLRRQLDLAGVSDRVLLLGHRDDVSTLMYASDLMLMPSRFEGQPLALLEALARRLPAVVSDAGAFTELIVDGVHGLIAPVGDPVALASATTWALANPVEMARMAAAGRRLVEDRFSLQRMLDETFAALSSRDPVPPPPTVAAGCRDWGVPASP